MECDSLLFEMICAHVSESEEIELVNFIKRFSNPNEVVHSFFVNSLKDYDNCLFKQGNYDDAYRSYVRTAQLLYCILPHCKRSHECLCQLTTSLNLDIITCAIKLRNSHRAMPL